MHISKPLVKFALLVSEKKSLSFKLIRDDDLPIPWLFLGHTLLTRFIDCFLKRLIELVEFIFEVLFDLADIKLFTLPLDVFPGRMVHVLFCFLRLVDDLFLPAALKDRG
jgi:hypothetical protein